MLKSGIKTTEFWVGLVGSTVIAVSQQLWPDSPIPAMEFTTLLTWTVARFGEKALSKTEGKRAWLTTEFWVAIGFTTLKSFVPELPESIEALVMGYIIGRPAVKVMEETDLATVLSKK